MDTEKQRKKEKKREKRKEQYKKAVEHKMKSAAQLVDGYREAYESVSTLERSAGRKHRKIVNKKLFHSVSAILLQTLLLILILIMLFLPMKKGFESVIDDYFSSSRPDFSLGQLQEEYVGSTNERMGVYYADVDIPVKGTYYAEITVADTNSRVYYGLSDAALLNGVCQYSKTSMPGFDKPMLIYGYSSTFFNNIENLKVDDTITLTTNYGVYKYKIKSTSVFSDTEKVPYNLEQEKEILVLCTDYPFSEYKSSSRETYCVISEKVSGPKIAY